jgi:hypothetical protein
MMLDDRTSIAPAVALDRLAQLAAPAGAGAMICEFFFHS